MASLEDLRAGRLAGSRELRLQAGLTDFPPEIFDLADTLEVLDLSGNALSRLPPDLHRLHRLRVLFCSDNRFTVLPEVLGACPQLSMVGFKANRIGLVPAAALPAGLRWLILTDNRIESLPDTLGACSQLQKLMLAGNRLQTLPDTLAQCQRLELLRLAANAFDHLPQDLLQLPRLSWLAFGGNPLTELLEDHALAQSPIASRDWASVQLQQRLGQGASGSIHQVVCTDTAPAEALALKLFKGAVTSDGLPASEMAASLHAGAHPALLSAVGQLHGHPEGTAGLFMPLMGPQFQVLAGPPSLASCTRDVYAEALRLPLAVALRLAHAVAAALAHLHDKGVSHGDVYAHNILYRADGEARLGDFGAASLTARLPAYQQALVHRLEVRAFGCLLEELLDRVAEPVPAPTLLAAARRWQASALAAQPTDRPGMATLQAGLAALLADLPIDQGAHA